MLRKCSRMLFGAVITLLAVGLAVGCGPTPVPSPTQAEAPVAESTAPPATATEVSAPAKWVDFTTVRVYTRTPDQIDPHGPGMSSTNYQVNFMLYEPLIRYKSATGKLEGVLATDWEVGPEAKSFTFMLRDGVKFHDGSTLTAEAVKLSFERLQRLGYGRGKYLRGMEKVEVVDDLTVRVHLKGTDAIFLYKVPELPIVSAEALKAHGEDDWLKTHEAGSYAYTLEYYQPGEDTLRFQPFPDYWGGWEPIAGGTHVGPIEWRGVPEPATIRMLVFSGEAHQMQYMPPAYFVAAQKEPNITAKAYTAYTVSNIPINVGYGPLQDKRLREMLKYAFPYDALIESYYQGIAEPAAGPIHPDLLSDPTLQPPKQDLDRARELLAEAGYKPGELSLTYWHPTGQDAQKQPGILLQDALRQIGVNLKVEEIPWVNITERVAAGPEGMADLFTLINGPMIADPGIGVLESLYHSVHAGEAYNWGYYNNPEFDDLLDRAQLVRDEEERMEMYRQAQRILVDDVAALWLAFPKWTVVTHKDLLGYVYEPTGIDWIAWYDMYWKQ